MSDSDDLRSLSIPELRDALLRLKIESLPQERLTKEMLIADILSAKLGLNAGPVTGSSTATAIHAARLFADALIKAQASLDNSNKESCELRAKNAALLEELQLLRDEHVQQEAPDLRLGALACLVAKNGGNRFRNPDGTPNVHQIVNAVHAELGSARGLGKSRFQQVLSDSIRRFQRSVVRRNAQKPESESESD